MERKDFLLLVVNAADGKPLSPVQLQKSLFLIYKAHLPELPETFYDFEPYHYGPFDIEVYHDADRLQQDDLVLRIPSERGDWVDTVITPEGRRVADELGRELSNESREFIHKIVHWVMTQSFSSLIRYIYEHYPEFREKSVFAG